MPHGFQFDSQLQALITEAVVLNDAAPSYTRSGSAHNPDTDSDVAANSRIRRSVVIGGQTVQFDFVEKSSTNLASSLSTGTYTTSVTRPHSIWWDGGAADYTISTNGSGVILPVAVTADGRNYVVITGITSGDTITCTRAGSPTNTHLQVEAWYHPTSKIALSSSRSGPNPFRTTGRSFGDTGTIVAVLQPYGWSYDQEYVTGTFASGWTVFRNPTGNCIWLTQSGSFKNSLYAARFWTGGSGSRQQPAGLIDGKYRTVAFSWSTTDGVAVNSSGWDFEEVSDFGGSAGSPVAATAPFTNDSNLDIGSWAPGGGVQFNGWVLLLHYTRVLSQVEIDILSDAFEEPSGRMGLLATWGDSETAYSSGLDWPSVLWKNQFQHFHTYNGGVGGETVAQVSTRYMTKPHLWRGCQTFWDQNSLDLSGMQGMVNTLGHKNYLVFSAVNSSAQPSGSAGYNSTIAANASYLAAIGAANYLDVRSIMISFNDSATDATDTTNDVIGTSMRSDAIHISTGVGHPRVAALVAAKFLALKAGYTDITYAAAVTNVLGTEYILLPAPGTGKRLVLVAVLMYNTGGSSEGIYIYRGPVSAGAISTKTYILGSQAGDGSTGSAVVVSNGVQGQQWSNIGGLVLPENHAVAVTPRDGGKHIQCVAVGYIANYP